MWQVLVTSFLECSSTKVEREQCPFEPHQMIFLDLYTNLKDSTVLGLEYLQNARRMTYHVRVTT